ncbi:ABC transporter permease [Helicobacter enhydrae]|uniref:ABC transporter permease n=1 Tax=Helicobacter enhydrae TaxID=222136 RepID=A0A1B1U4X3_9HELI|nr:ABC transporter permease [Helicobacter enhydrae]ANV97800.1 ABC transporter permease [Helicobacter enhydrae]
MDFILNGFYEAFLLLYHLDSATTSAIYNTFSTSTLSIFIATFVGLPLGFGLGYFNFRGKKTLKIICDTLLAFPTVVVGLIVYAFINAQGPLGHYGLLFSNTGVIIGQTILALPIVIALSSSVVENMNPLLRLTLKSFNLTHAQMIKTTLWELRHSLLSVIITAYSRIISEIGIAMMIGGNIKWHTRTITTAISLETNKGEFALAIALGIVLVIVALLINLALSLLKEYKS